MRTNKTLALVPAVAVLSLMLSAAPALAGQSHRSASSSSHGAPQTHSAPQAQSRPQSAAPQSRTPQAAPRSVAPQQFDSRYAAPYSAARVDPRYEAPRYASPRYAEPRYVPRVYVAHPTYRPYYTFRPRFSLGIGLYLGYPVGFPSWYSYPYGSYNYGYGYADPAYGGGYVGAAPGYGSYGGVSFDIAPLEAGVFVDGSYVGVAADFSPTESPLTLSAGRHRVELRADGFISQSFDVTVIAGQVLPMQGTLQAR